MKPSRIRLPLRLTLFYLAFGCLWILLSDQLLSMFLFHDLEQALYQTIKGWFFVAVSGLFLYVLLRRDFAEHKQSETDLRESEERFRLMFENNPAVMMLIEPTSGAIRDANHAASLFYGYSLAELVAMNIHDINQLSPEEVQAERMRALREERNFFQFQHRLSNGEDRLVEVHSAPIRLTDETLLFSIIHDVTQRQHTESQLQHMQNRMKGIVEAAMDAIISTDASQVIVLANPAAVEMFGYEEADLIGKPLTSLLPERYRASHYEHVRRFGKTGATTRSMHALGAVYGLRASGDEFPAEASISQISIGEEKIYTVIMRDITERRRSEERIQHQVQRLSALRAVDVAISSSFDMQVSLDVLLHEVRRQLGVDAAAVLLLQPRTLTLVYAAGKGFRSAGIEHTRMHIHEGLAGRAAAERQELHVEDLSQTGNRFVRSEVLEGEGFLSYYVTPLIAKGEVNGVLEVYHRSHLQTNSEWLDFLRILAGQAALAIENAQLFENLHRSNVELEQHVMERTTELNRTNAELERANRAKDEFLATMSHELRTPLNSILGLSESMLEERRGVLNEHQRNSLRIIESSGHHLLELINDILDLSKIEAGMFDLYLQPVSVDEFCRSCLAFVRSQAARKSISITYTNDAPMRQLLADPRRLKQILVNVLTNAVKFTPDKGQVALHVTGDVERDLIQFSVADTGIGIAPGDLRRLFQPFVQVDSSLNRQYEGTGLGLALVQKLTDLHGGSVQVESEPGKGSRFTVSLTSKQDEIVKQVTDQSESWLAASSAAPAAQLSQEVHVSAGRILLAEDNLPNILTIGEYLESYHYTVIVAHDGFEAIAKAQEDPPDLILMDIQMPILNGLEAMARLRQEPRFAATPIIALTALAMPGDRERCLRAGANEYLSKPVSLKQLVKTIDAMLHPH